MQGIHPIFTISYIFLFVKFPQDWGCGCVEWFFGGVVGVYTEVTLRAVLCPRDFFVFLFLYDVCS